MDRIEIRGAEEHNLKGVDLDIPRDSLTVFTGVSGSGKSSLAFDTIYREGQRRFSESLSPYARQYLGRIERPSVERIDGLSPTISIDQSTAARNPRSTVGTITEIWDHIRLLYARLGTAHCPRCGGEIRSETADRITDRVLREFPGRTALIAAPIVRGRKGEHRGEIEDLKRSGYRRFRIAGRILQADGPISLDRRRHHTIEVIIDRVVPRPRDRSRLAESVEKALSLAKGFVDVLVDGEEHHYSARFACPECGIYVPEIEPRLFSFNSPHGMCPRCHGLGDVVQIEPRLLVSDPSLSIRGGALAAAIFAGYFTHGRVGMADLGRVALKLGFSLDTPWQEIPEDARRRILYGPPEHGDGGDVPGKGHPREPRAVPGVIPILEKVHRLRGRMRDLEPFLVKVSCPSCRGARVRPEALAVTFHGRTVGEMGLGTTEELLRFFRSVPLTPAEEAVGRDIVREVTKRLVFLERVGLGYLGLGRGSNTLGGGELRRVQLAGRIGSNLSGVLYVLDEPSIGLHPRDNRQLLDVLLDLRDSGNTVCVVEHDMETIRTGDHIVDLGPGGGDEGGTIVATGPPRAIRASPDSVTGRYLRGETETAAPGARRPAGEDRISIRGARLHNLKSIDVEFPLGLFIAVTGVSGSGKTTLVGHTLCRAIRHEQEKHAEELRLGRDRRVAAERRRFVPTLGQTSDDVYREIDGWAAIDAVVEVDQSPIGRSPRSNPATYTKLFARIRDLFAALPESRARGYDAGRFSFNREGGRCEGCRGGGSVVFDMKFLPGIEVPCDECGGKRYNRETLEVTYRGRTISQVLDMKIREARDFFRNHPRIERVLAVMDDVGVGYLKLGQAATTLSAGEAQRVKLSAELARPPAGRTLYVLDEPTTGLHAADLRRLIESLNALVQQGNTVVVIEHNPEVIKAADHVIDLGPEGGEGGGRVVFAGTPDDLVDCEGSHTGRALAAYLAGRIGRPRDRRRPRPASDAIRLRGARCHNLKNLRLRIPRNALVVLTGVSGSGKTSLAVDTLASEGQRRYMEGLSTYARRFLGGERAPEIESLEGITPAIAIRGARGRANPRSTLATATEIFDHLRLLYARVGRPHCPECRRPIVGHSPSNLAASGIEHHRDRRGYVLVPLETPRSRKGLERQRRGLIQEGFTRILVGEEERRLEEPFEPEDLPRFLVIDRVVFTEAQRTRISGSVEQAYGRSPVVILRPAGEPGETFSRTPACDRCGFRLESELEPRSFSFNSHIGACPTCSGLGFVRSRGPRRDEEPAEGSPCPLCNGGRLKPAFLSVQVGGRGIHEVTGRTIRDCRRFLQDLPGGLSGGERTAAEPVLREILGRLAFLDEVGVGHLTLDRRTDSLSAGEAHRVRLAGQLGSRLAGVLYVLDEPTIGLHPRDTARLLDSLRELRDLGNTVVVVEHDPEVIRAADHVVDLGPGAGRLGGSVVASGTPESIARSRRSLTGAYLSGRRSVPVPPRRRAPGQDRITVRGGTANNLRSIDVAFPLGLLTAVTGVSGSGKSTLVFDVLARSAREGRPRGAAGLSGLDEIRRTVVVDQSPIGRSPKSCPATYAGALDPIRELFALLPEARVKGFEPGRFSFNSPEGRCPRCGGLGSVGIDMSFLADVWVPCEACQGRRYNSETLTVRFRGNSIADVLAMEVHRAVEVFENHPKVLPILRTLEGVGLGYLTLGQPANTLSGGESQRLKLGTELARTDGGGNLYLLDEPTTGLHSEDVLNLVAILHRLVDGENTVIVIEHNLDLIANADWIVDLGPEGGEQGGHVVFAGPPEGIGSARESVTGRYLAPFLEGARRGTAGAWLPWSPGGRNA